MINAPGTSTEIQRAFLAKLVFLRDAITSTAVTNVVLIRTFDTFTLFSKLPPELRCKIWCIASQVSRIVVLDQCLREASDGRDVIVQRIRSPQSAIVHTSKEARQEALKVYTVDLGAFFTSWNSDTPDVQPAIPHLRRLDHVPKIYTNWANDTLYVSGEFNDFVMLEDVRCSLEDYLPRGIQTLAIDLDLFQEGANNFNDFPQFRSYTMLSELILVVRFERLIWRATSVTQLSSGDVQGEVTFVELSEEEMLEYEQEIAELYDQNQRYIEYYKHRDDTCPTDLQSIKVRFVGLAKGGVRI